MLGGARIVLFVVLQESRITASAAVPPAPHKIFSRLPWNHRVSLECHTVGEYCQKREIATTHFFGKICPRVFLDLLAFFASPSVYTICSGRFPGESFKNAIELREGLKPDLERDLADPKIAVCQKLARLVEPGTRNVIDKIYAGHLPKLFAEMGRTDVDRFRHLGQRDFFVRMMLDKLSRPPDVRRLRSTLAMRSLFEWVRRYHLDDNWPAIDEQHSPLLGDS